MTNVDAGEPAVLSPAPDMRTLLGLGDREFVTCAYLTILNRAPDPSGLAHYAQQLRAGQPRIEILSALYRSNEAKSVKVRIPWLRKAILQHSFTRLLFGLPRAIVRRRQPDIPHRLDLLEHEVAALRDQASKMAEIVEMTRVLQQCIATTDKAAEAGMAQRNPAHLSEQSLVAKRIFKQLSEAIAEARGKSP